MCFGLPKGVGMKNDVKVVLSMDCQIVFETVNDGVLKTSDFCIHPLGGGTGNEGQRLCYYKSCDREKRLQYKLYKSGIVNSLFGSIY